MPDQPQKIGKYEILEQIGVGGFGAVYRGRDPFIKRTVAVKTCQLNDDEIKSRFFREAELAGNLHHRNITTIYDFGVENGVPYIVQEFLTGEDLDKIIKRSDKMPVARKIEILMAISDGLGYAHQHSIIHRDIKPSNIRVLADGSVKIMDFGIAKSLETESSLTQTGITLGTSAYLAPEQIRGEPLDQRTDMFALGILAYELLSYRKPFRGEHLSTVLYKILNENPEPLETANPEVPAALSAVVARAMEKSIDQRYADMQAFRQDLQAVYRELSGISSRFITEPRFAQSGDRPTRTEIDADATIVTPSEGMPLPRSITPPSGALARVPDPAADHTPTVMALRPAGLEVVNFRDPSQRATDRPVELHSSAHRRGHGLLWIAVIVAALVSGGVVFFLSRPTSTTPVPSPRPTPAPTAPIAFPQPVVGTEPGKARVAPTAAPQVEPTAAPVEQKVEQKAEASPRPAPPKKFKIQFSSMPAATLFVDGRRYGPSIPAKTIELPEGTHKVRFEAADLPVYEKEFRVGSAGTPPIAYRFPIGHLVIRAPAWVGATVLVDSKFKGVLTGEKTFLLPSGSHRITLSRQDVAPLTQNVTVPEGDKYTWTPPPPGPVS